LPHQEAIQRSFGTHDVSGIRAHVGGEAADASRALGAHAFATGNDVAFASSPDLHTAAHEAAHVVQQREGVVSYKGLDGGAGDVHEQHADRVADAVVAGESAAPLLDMARGGASNVAVQRDQDASDGMSYGPELALSQDSIAFGSVPVGKSSGLRSFSVTNRDSSRAVEIENIKDLSREAVGEFPIGGLNVELKPGQSVSLDIGFSPARWGDRSGMLQIQGSAGALAHLRVSGTGTDHTHSNETRQKTEEAEVDKARADKGLEHKSERATAEADIDRLNKKVTKFAEGYAHWASMNYTRFLSETGGDFTVSWTEGQFINAVGAVGSGIVGLIVPGGPLVGAVAGTLFSLIYGGIFTAKGNADDEKTVHDNLKKAGKSIEEQADRFESHKDASLSEADEAAASAEHKLWTTQDLEVIEQLQLWAQEELALVPEPPKKGDRSLYEALLKDWVRERAGDANQANKHTNDPAWNDAREKSFGKKGDEKLEEPDLFIYQARHEWSKLGVGGVAEAEAEMRGKFERLRAEGVEAGLSGDRLASYIKNMMGEVWVFLPVHEPSQTAKILQEINVNRDRHDYSGRRLGCEVWLDTDGGSVTVSGFSYHLDGRLGERRLK